MPMRFQHLRVYSSALLAVAVITACARPLRDVLTLANFTMVYFLLVLIIAICSGTGQAFVSAFVSFMCINFFLVPPYSSLWVADPRGHRVVRAIEGRGIVQTIRMSEGRHAFACMLGGEDRRDLYICTSTASGPAMGEKRDGASEVIRVEVAGAGLP